MYCELSLVIWHMCHSYLSAKSMLGYPEACHLLNVTPCPVFIFWSKATPHLLTENGSIARKQQRVTYLLLMETMFAATADLKQ